MANCPKCNSKKYLATGKCVCGSTIIERDHCPNCGGMHTFTIMRGQEICWHCHRPKYSSNSLPNNQQSNQQQYPQNYQPNSQGPYQQGYQPPYQQNNKPKPSLFGFFREVMGMKNTSDENIRRMREKSDEKIRARKASKSPPPNPCPVCHNPMQFYEQVRQWYCSSCKKYYQ